MKVSVTLTLDVDPEAWAVTYGVTGDPIRLDVRSYVLTSLQGSAAAEEGAIREVILK